MKYKVIGVEEARALASTGLVDIWARKDKFHTWVFCDPTDSALFDFAGMTDAMHAELNKETQYRVQVDG